MATKHDKKLQAIEDGKMTFAEAMGLTRSEAYGIAFVAHRWFQHGQGARAKKILETLIMANPKDAYFHALLGGIHGREGNEDKALEHYSAAIKIDPNNLTARVNRADLMLRRGILDKALEDLVAATKIDPKAKTALGKRALALARTTSKSLHAVLKRAKAGPRPSTSTSSKPRR